MQVILNNKDLINAMKRFFIFIIILLCSSTLQAEVKVLCLDEGKCVKVDNNSVHPGSLSGASLAELQSFIKFLSAMALDEGIIVSSPPDTDDRNLLNEYF